MEPENNTLDGVISDAHLKTIYDLREDYFDGFDLSTEQKKALKNFDKLRVDVLSHSANDVDFQEKYYDLQFKENTLDYRIFLD